MFLVSVLSVGLIKKGVYVNLRKEIKEFISRIFYGRFNTSCHIGKVVAECISNAFRVSWAYVIFSNSGWDCRCGDHSQKNTLGKMNGAKNLIQN